VELQLQLDLHCNESIFVKCLKLGAEKWYIVNVHSELFNTSKSNVFTVSAKYYLAPKCSE